LFYYSKEKLLERTIRKIENMPIAGQFFIFARDPAPYGTGQGFSLGIFDKIILLCYDLNGTLK